MQLGYSHDQIEQSLEMERYDEIWAAYHLLSMPIYAVSSCSLYQAYYVLTCQTVRYRTLVPTMAQSNYWTCIKVKSL